jgi:hypothetical protein
MKILVRAWMGHLKGLRCAQHLQHYRENYHLQKTEGYANSLE